jgi:hypothetical protein
MKIRMLPWRPLLELSGALLLLSALLNVNYPADRLFSWRLLLPSGDVCVLLALTAMAAWGGGRTLFRTGLAAWVLFMALRLFRIGDITIPFYLNRPFNLYIDSRYLFDLYDLLKTSARKGQFLMLAAFALTLVLGVMAASGYAFRAAARALSDRPIRILFLGGSGLILAAALVGGWRAAEPPAMIRLGRQILSIEDQRQQERAFVARLEKTARARAAGPAALKELAGADVLLFMVESYGRTVFSRPNYRPAMEATMARFGGVLARHGFKACSTYLVSPTYGGSSWLAHDTLESGLRVDNDLKDTTLLRSAVPPMASYFRKSGYRTVSVMPGSRFPFSEGAYFDYEQVYYARHFDYRGPTFGWAPMPDQYVLDWVRRREFTQRERPLFVRYVLISSHAPFNIQPPFIPDWDLIGDGGIFKDRPAVYYPIYWPDLKNAGEAYLRSLDYDFTTLGDYFARFVTADTLIIIMGDHQPNLQLTDAGEPWSVPVHIISGNPRLLDPFRRRGYTPGLTPDQPPPHAGMETFLQGFLQDFADVATVGSR